MRRRLVRNDATQKAAVRPSALHNLLFFSLASFVQTLICQSVYRSMRAWLLRVQSLHLQSAVIDILQSFNPSGHTVALGSTRPLTEMNTKNTSWGLKTAGA